MRAALLWTINDFPAYGDLSGWGTKGALACPPCNYETSSKWLKHGGKYAFGRTRRFLPTNHKFRTDAASFDGTKELGAPPRKLSGSDRLEQIEKIFDKNGKRKFSEIDPKIPWKKRSAFYKLSYWEYHVLPHNLDVMHIEKNVSDNIIGTILNVRGKTKDNKKARLDLEEMGIRSDLHSIDRDTSNSNMPHASFAMSLQEKDLFLKVLKDVKVPDGYSSNLSNCIHLKERKIMGLKSHDGHVLMQHLLAIALRGVLPKKVSAPIIELCNIFRELCSKVVDIKEIEKLECRTVEALCYLEQIFPPAFFTIMVHLVLHLPNEVKLAGPVLFRWMYPVERYLCQLKSYVKNKAHPEGSIAEGYLAEECLTFCSRYLDSVDTLSTRPTRNVDGEIGAVTYIELDRKSWTQVHRYVLFNSEDISQFRSIHRDAIKRQHRNSRLTDTALNKLHLESFVDWFQSYVSQLEDEKDDRVSDKISWLARGPNTSCKRYKGYVVNGIKFRTAAYERTRKTQNSGVRVDTEGNITYYGVLTDIIELNYYDKLRYVLFKCNWADVTSNRGCKVDEFGFTLVNFSQAIHAGERLIDEPFVLSSQARQVYYVNDQKHENWLVVVKTNPRDVFEMGFSGLSVDELDS